MAKSDLKNKKGLGTKEFIESDPMATAPEVVSFSSAIDAGKSQPTQVDEKRDKGKAKTEEPAPSINVSKGGTSAGPAPQV